MKSSPRLVLSTLNAALGATLAAALLAGCSSPPPPPPIPVAVVPPAAPPPPPVALPRPVLEAAGAYRVYMKRASEITPAFANGMAVEESLVSGVAYEPKQLLRGAIAYAALVALQSPQFVAGVRTYAVDPVQRRELAARLIADPNYASALPSAASAAGLIAATLASDAAKVRHAGELVRQAAYDVQHQDWSKGEVAGRPERLANAKTLSGQTITPPDTEVELLSSAVSGTDAAGANRLAVVGDAMAPPYTPVIARGLALAALAALGEAGAADPAAIQPLMDDTGSAFCFNMSKLNTYQCLSVAKPYYEDVFCLGQHVLLDTAQCVSRAAGVAQKVAVVESAPPAPAPAATPAPAKSKAAKARARRSASR